MINDMKFNNFAFVCFKPLVKNGYDKQYMIAIIIIYEV